MTNQKYTTIFFDWGGVIANDPGDEFLGQLLRDVGATETEVQDIFETYMKRFMRGQISEAEYWQELRNKYGFTIHDSISDEFKKWRGLIANEDILALAEEASNKGLNIAILSNVIEPTYNVIEQAGYYKFFDEIIASCKVGYVKPENEIYEIALNRFGVLAAESVSSMTNNIVLTRPSKWGSRQFLRKIPSRSLGTSKLVGHNYFACARLLSCAFSVD